MPGVIDGIGLVEAVGARTKVILMSAFLDEATRCRADAAGAWRILDKPCGGRHLVEQVRAAVAAGKDASAG
jgi:DNA-binding response OmpR family regulator